MDESSLQPDPKKLKMSTTSDDDTAAAAEADQNKTPKYKRRKIAIFFAYCGVGYQGMQKNPGAKTIEADLEEALFLSGAVPEADRGCPKRFDWARSARTDKGVSAVGQVVSGRFYVDPPGLVERLNSILPAQIRIFGYKRATPSFNAKKFCDRRRYVYLIPVFALDPNSHPDRESVLASLGSENELAKCLECSERGRKVEGVMGKRVYEPKEVKIEVTAGSGISSNGESAMLETDTGGKTQLLNGDANSDHHEVKGDGIDSDISQNQIGISSNSEADMLDSTIEEKSYPVDNNDNINRDYNNQEKADMIDSSISNNSSLGIETQKDITLNGAGAVLESGIINDNLTVIDSPDTVKGDGVDIDLPKNVPVGTESEMGILSDNKIGEDMNGVVTKEIDNGGVESDQPRGNGIENDMAVKRSGFRYGEEERERFNRILKRYVGTHNFHNFTTRIKAEDPSATRYIISFDANTVVNVDGIDFVKCEVVGQSFMLHQIRKMVGVAVAIMRNCADESLIETAFQRGVNITVPTAPEVGLYLDECFFSSYNQKWKDTHEEVSMKAYENEAEEFKMKHIYSHISSMEQKEGSVALWLHSLNYRNYPDLRIGGNTGGNSEVKVDEPK